MPRLVIDIDLGRSGTLSGDDIRLLELIDQKGSITAGGRAHGLRFRQTWERLNTMNHAFNAKLVEAHAGGADGGGSELTSLGREVVRRYRAIEAGAAQTSAADLAAFQALISRRS